CRMTRREPIRVLVADDSVTMRTALVALLTDEQDLRVVGQARDGVEAVEKARALRPDVITMDVNMPRLDGLGATAAIMAESPSRVLMVCAISEDRQLDLSFRAMAAGARVGRAAHRLRVHGGPGALAFRSVRGARGDGERRRSCSGRARLSAPRRLRPGAGSAGPPARPALARAALSVRQPAAALARPRARPARGGRGVDGDGRRRRARLARHPTGGRSG